MKKKILVPVDFSALSDAASAYAAAIAGMIHADVILYHSFFDQVYFSDGGFSTGFESGLLLTDELIHDLFKKKEEQLLAFAGMLTGQYPGVKFEARTESGDPVLQIPNACLKIAPELVVMGSARLGRKGRFAGSVCEKAMTACGVPVLAVAETVKFQKISAILYMTGFEPADTEAILKLSDTLSGYDGKFFCLHLESGKEEQLDHDKMDELAEKVMMLRLPQQFSFHVLSSENPHIVLEQFIKRNGIGLIAFIPHRRSFFRSLLHQEITKKDLFLTHVPILSLP
jgi:nucleotide-binding universal stress UspA family protein